MNKYILIAAGEELDTYSELDISLNYQIDDILDIAKRNTNYSKTISIPGTPFNNKFFKQIFDVNIDNINFNPSKSIETTIRIGDNEVFKGYLQLINIIINNEEVEYEVVIAGSLKNIINEFGDYLLSDLDLSEYNHIRNRDNITNSWDHNIIKWGQSHQGVMGEGYIYPYIVTGGSSDITNTAYIYDLYPAVYNKTIIDKLFEFSNFTYTSNFFNSEYFAKLIVPFTGDKIQKDEETLNEESTRVGIAGVSTTTSELMGLRQRSSGWWKNYNENGWNLFLNRESGIVDDSGSELEFQDPLGSWNGGAYICQKSGYYDISFSGKLFPYIVHDNNKNDMEFKEGDFEYFYRLRKNGTILDRSDSAANPGFDVNYFGLSSGTHASPWLDLDTSLQMDLSADNVYLTAGDVIRIDYGFNYPGSVKWYGSSDNKHRVQLVLRQSFDGSFSKFTVVPSSNKDMGNAEINMNQVLPANFKMKDYFLDIIKMFNLVIQDNPNKKDDLIIEPREDFFKSRQRVLDWDDKLDNDSDVKIKPMSELDARAYLYSYDKDDDLYNKEYYDETKKVYGEYLIDVDNDFSDKVRKTKLKFAATPDAEKYIDGRVAPFFVEKDDENFKPKKVKPRILFYGGKIGTDFLVISDYPGGVSTVTYNYPYCGMWDHPVNPEHDLAFGWTEKVYWNTSKVPVNNLYESFHKFTMSNIIDINARLLEAKLHLTPKDIADFDFRDIIFLKDAYWRVNKIKDYNPVGADSLTKVVLYKINDLITYDKMSVEIPSTNASCPTDMVAVIGKKGNYFISESGQPVTETCCDSMGGTMINGVCRINRPVKPTGGIKPVKPIKYVLPISQPEGPDIFLKDQNTNGSLGVKIYGKNNYVREGVENVVVIGDNISVTKSNGVYIGDTFIDEGGQILDNGNSITIIDGGADVVLEILKTNLIDVVDGGVDAVRNFGGSSKERPIIDGNNE